MDTCEKCGKDVRIGDFPFCPHEQVSPHYHTVFIPYVDHFGSSKPEGHLVTSHRDRMKMLKANNLDFKSRTGMPGCEV